MAGGERMETPQAICVASDAASDGQHPAVLVCAPDSTIRYANGAAASLFGVAPHTLTGALPLDRGWRPVRDDGSPAPPEKCPIARAIMEKQPVEGRLAEIALGARARKVRVCAYPDLDAAGSVRRVFVTLTPAETKSGEALEQALRQAAQPRLLQGLDRLQGAMKKPSEPEPMMREALDALLAIFDCDRAFLLYPCDPEAPFWEALMERTRSGFPSAFTLGKTTPMTEETAAPMRALRASAGPMKFDAAAPGAEPSALEPSSKRPPAHPLLAHSLLAMAIQPKFCQPWMFGLHRQTGSPPWTQWEMTLFQEIGGRLTDSLIGLLACHNLRDSERKYREVFDNVSESLILFSVGEEGQLRISDVNPAAEAIIGLKRSAVLGKSIEEIAAPEAAARTAALLKQVMDTGESITYDETAPTSSGSRILSTTLLPVRDETGSICRLIVISRDITGRRLAESEVTILNQQLSQRVQALEKANKELENISYSVSHAMKIPLRAIDGFTCLLREECVGRLEGGGRRYLEVIRQSAARLTALIDGLLDFIKLFSQPMHVGKVDMTGLAREIFRERAARSPERLVNLTMAQLPPAHGDRSMIRQVLANLMDNAFKFTARRAEAHIEIGGAVEDGKSAYFIRDNGAGFDMRYSDSLFGVFSRLHSQEEFEGPGAGLAIVKRIIERHGGEIWAEGKVDEGATVHFTLPAPPGTG
jgi:PAS domain S-box-containing protein